MESSYRDSTREEPPTVNPEDPEGQPQPLRVRFLNPDPNVGREENDREGERLDPKKKKIFSSEEAKAMITRQEERCKKMAKGCKSSWTSRRLKEQVEYWHTAGKELSKNVERNGKDAGELQQHYAIYAAIEGECYDRALREKEESKARSWRQKNLRQEIERSRERVRVLQKWITTTVYQAPPRTGVDAYDIFKDRCDEGYDENEGIVLGHACPTM